MLKITHSPLCGSDDILRTMQHLADELNCEAYSLNFHTFIITRSTEAEVFDWLENEGFAPDEVKVEVLKAIPLFED